MKFRDCFELMNNEFFSLQIPILSRKFNSNSKSILFFSTELKSFLMRIYSDKRVRVSSGIKNIYISNIRERKKKGHNYAFVFLKVYILPRAYTSLAKKFVIIFQATHEN